MTELYLYQILHLHGGQPRLVGAHVAVLDQASQELFGRPYQPDIRHLTARITALAKAERYPHSVSGFVRLELLPDGTERLIPAGVSLYDGYALRSLRPTACTLDYHMPLSQAPTSAREAITQLAQLEAAHKGTALAVQCDSQGIMPTTDEAPVFGVCAHTVLTAPISHSVERDLAIHAIRAAGLELRDEPLTKEDLPRLDELFYVDHRGVTALASCDGRPLMALIAERVAAVMESLFAEK